jgi:hypothetical protein
MTKRGPVILKRIRQLIHVRSLEEPRAPRDAVALHLIEEIERMGEISPTEETLKRMVSAERNREPNPLEKSWGLGILSKNKDDFPPELISVIIEMKKLKMRDDWEGSRDLTIRQAQWIARLYPLIKEIHSRKYSNKDCLLMVWMISDIYAKREEMDEIVGEKYFDSSDLDEEIFISERFWEQPMSDKAVYYTATQSLYLAIQHDYNKDKKRNNDDNKRGEDERFN